MLHKNHEFVDWVRVDIGEDEKQRVQNVNANSNDADSFRDMDERAFEKFKNQWQEISAADAITGSNSSLENLPKVQDSIMAGKKLIATATAKTLTPDSISYGVFDADWNPVKLTPRHSNVDVAILLHAASEEEKNGNVTGMRTYLTEKLVGDPATTHTDITKSKISDGKLPIVPVKRSAKQQFLIKQSVQLFFGKNSIEFFACFPLRHSPRTIYRFDMINGGIDHTFWQKMKIKNSSEGGDKNNDKLKAMNAKLIEMRSKVASNTADLQKSLQTSTDEFKYNLNAKVSNTKESFRNLKNKKMTNNSNDGEDGTSERTDASTKLSEMRLKMANNATSMKTSFASKMMSTKSSLLNNNDAEGGTAITEPEKTNMSTKLSQMKLSMSQNTSRMKFGFGSKSLLSSNSNADEDNNGNSEVAEVPRTMSGKFSQMKLRMSEKNNQMKQRMSENTTSFKNSFTSKVSTTKTSFWSLKNKKNKDTSNKSIKKEEKKEATTSDDIDSLFADGFDFTIDEEDDHCEPTTSLMLGSDPSASSPAGYVALSLDDAPCRFDDRSHSQLENVLDLLKKYDAKATFMVISSFLADCHEPDMIRLLVEGHELANHGVKDEAMDKMATSVETFVEALDECNNKITDLQKKAGGVEVGVKWFRAPQSRYTKTMEEGLVQRDMHNVMCDAYAACPIVEDGPWIASALSKQIKNGSIAILHMPEKLGFREHCLEALERLLEELKKRNFKVVTVGELHQLSEAVAASKIEESKEEAAIVPV